MATSTCRLCGVVDDIARLVEACECHKKSDAALCHVGCLEAYIEKRRQSERDSVSADAMRCPKCEHEFRVKLQWRWTNARYLSGTSLNQYFNFVMIVLTSLSFFYAVFRILRSNELHGATEERLVWGMAAVIAAMAVLVIWTVYKRWKRHQMDAELVGVV